MYAHDIFMTYVFEPVAFCCECFNEDFLKLIRRTQPLGTLLRAYMNRFLTKFWIYNPITLLVEIRDKIDVYFVEYRFQWNYIAGLIKFVVEIHSYKNKVAKPAPKLDEKYSAKALRSDIPMLSNENEKKHS